VDHQPVSLVLKAGPFVVLLRVRTMRVCGLIGVGGILTMTTAQSSDLAERARLGEALRYDSLWIPEHPLLPLPRMMSFPASPEG
jgi:hypothetical protein